MINLLRVFGLLSCILIIAVALNIYFYDSLNMQQLNFYGDQKVRGTCPDSPGKLFYQECFRKDLSKALSDFSPIDTYVILQRLDELYLLESYHLKTEEDKIKAFILKYENLILFAESSSNLTIDRNKFNFYTFPLIPVAKFYTKLYFKKQIEYFDQSKYKSLSLDKTNPLSHRLARVQKRIASITY